MVEMDMGDDQGLNTVDIKTEGADSAPGGASLPCSSPQSTSKLVDGPRCSW